MISSRNKHASNTRKLLTQNHYQIPRLSNKLIYPQSPQHTTHNDDEIKTRSYNKTERTKHRIKHKKGVGGDRGGRMWWRWLSARAIIAVAVNGDNPRCSRN